MAFVLPPISSLSSILGFSNPVDKPNPAAIDVILPPSNNPPMGLSYADRKLILDQVASSIHPRDLCAVSDPSQLRYQLGLVKKAVSHFGTDTVGRNNYLRNLLVQLVTTKNSALSNVLFSGAVTNLRREELISTLRSIPYAQLVMTALEVNDPALFGRIQGLIANGLISNSNQIVPLLVAAQNGHLEIFHTLLASGAISDADRGIALQFAAKNGHLEIVRALLASGNISDLERGHAVQAAVKHGHLEIVRALLASGNIRDASRFFACARAAEQGHLEIVRALLVSGPLSNFDRGLAAEKALRNGHYDVFDELLKNRSTLFKATSLALFETSGGWVSLWISF